MRNAKVVGQSSKAKGHRRRQKPPLEDNAEIEERAENMNSQLKGSHLLFCCSDSCRLLSVEGL